MYCIPDPSSADGHEVKLTAVERGGDSGDFKLALVRLNSTSAVAVESRRRTGYDDGMDNSGGAVVYVVDVDRDTGEVRSGDTWEPNRY